ncbi:hypothetical protein [Alsobacter sp. R-9]
MSVVPFSTARALLPDPADAIFRDWGAEEGRALRFLHQQGFDLDGDLRPLVGDLLVLLVRHPPTVVAARMGVTVEFVTGLNDPGAVGMLDALRTLVPHGAFARPLRLRRNPYSASHSYIMHK